MNLRTVPLHQINPAPYNPRTDYGPGDAAYEMLAKSMDRFACVQPPVWNERTGNLVGGHLRCKILRAQGHADALVVVVDLSLDEEKALNVALNKITGDWDLSKLGTLLDEIIKLDHLDIELTGFDLPEAKDVIAQAFGSDLDRAEDFDVAAELAGNRKPITRLGDLIQLGDHRLLCGDCTDPEQVKLVMHGEKAILNITDPPYLVDYDGTNHPSKKNQRDRNKNWSKSYGIAWDDSKAHPELYDKFVATALAEATLPNTAFYCFHASRRQRMVEDVWERHGLFVHQQIIWMKDRPILTRSWYCWQHEPLFFGWRKGNRPPRQSKDYPSTTWCVPTVPVGQPTEHPTSKPPELFMIAMKQHTRRGEVCYEPFAGSGSQIIAGQKLERRVFALEISPQYCDVIIRRFIRFAGEQAVSPEIAKRYRVEDGDVPHSSKSKESVSRDLKAVDA
jgi:DNA modification methylase